MSTLILVNAASFLLAASFAAAAPVELPKGRPAPGAQQPGSEPAPACCTIVSAESKTGIITARNNANRQTFQFSAGPQLAASVKPGQPVWADFASGIVTLQGAPKCCRILQVGSPPAGVGSTPGPAGPAVTSPVPRPKHPVAIGQRLGLPSPPQENEGNESDPLPRLPAVPKTKLGPAPSASGVVPVHNHPKAQEMLNAVAQAIAKGEINVALLGGSKYMINDCLGIKASAGEFRLKVSYPTAVFEGAAIKIRASIDKISLNALRVRVRPSSPPYVCHFSKAFGVGGSASNVVFELRLGGPTLDLNQCRLATLGPVHTRWHIGGLNLKPLQNNLDEVAKEMLEDSLNIASAVFMDPVGAALEGVLNTVCESKVVLYRRYMDQLGAGVGLDHLPDVYVQQLKDHYPKVNLKTVRFGFSSRQPPGNTTTDCHNIYSSWREFVDRLKGVSIGSDSNLLRHLYHELRHTEQCNEYGGRDFYAERWFRDFEISALTTNLNNPNYYKVLHDRMPMEKDAEAVAVTVLQKLPTLQSSLPKFPVPKGFPK